MSDSSSMSFAPVGAIGSDAIARPRVDALLEYGWRCPITLVQAPAGYGKTQAVQMWLKRKKVPHAFVRLEASLREPSAFWPKVAAGISSSQKGTGKPGEGCPSSGLPADSATTCQTVLELAGQAGPGFTLVLDDYDALGPDSGVHDELMRFMREMPHSMRMVLICRAFPRIGLARLRVDGSLFELKADQLAFTDLEVRTVFAQAGRALSAAQLEEAVGRTKGWPAMVRLVCRALAMADNNPVGTGDLWSAIDRDAYDYLDEEVLSKFGEQERDFLCATACLGEFDEAMAQTVLQWDLAEVRACVRCLADAGLFYAESVAEGAVMRYAYHPMFARVVSSRAFVRTEYSRKDVFGRACAEYERRGCFDDAVRLAGRAGDTEFIAHAIRSQWRRLYAADSVGELLSWYEALPEGAIVSDFELCIVQALPLAVANRRETSLARIRCADMLLRRHRDQAAIFYALSGLAYSVLGDGPKAAEASRRALDGLADGEDYLRAMAQQVVGGVKEETDPAAAIEVLEQSLPYLRGLGMSNPLCSAYANLAHACSAVGRYSEATDFAQRAKALFPQDEHEARPMLVLAYLACAAASYERDELDAFRDQMRFVNRHIASLSIPSAVTHAAMLDAMDAGLRGEGPQAVRCVLDPFSGNAATSLRAPFPLTLVLQWLEEGVFDLGVSKREIEAQFEDESLYRATGLLTLELLDVMGRVRATGVSEGVSSEAADLARRSFDAASALTLAPLLQIRLYVAASLAFEASGECDQAQNALFNAFEAAREERIARPFLDDAPLIEKIWMRVARDAKDSYAAELLKRVPLCSTAKEMDPAGLTQREMDVVRLAAEGLSVQGIADRLVVSRETVKKHLQNVYQKLGVHAKMQAVVVLRQRGLL